MMFWKFKRSIFLEGELQAIPYFLLRMIASVSKRKRQCRRQFRQFCRHLRHDS